VLRLVEGCFIDLTQASFKLVRIGRLFRYPTQVYTVRLAFRVDFILRDLSCFSLESFVGIFAKRLEARHGDRLVSFNNYNLNSSVITR
jgi:hypothetical protein